MTVTLGHKDRASNVAYITTDADEFNAWGSFLHGDDPLYGAAYSPALRYLWDRPAPGSHDLRTWRVPGTPDPNGEDSLFFSRNGIGADYPPAEAGTVEGPYGTAKAVFTLVGNNDNAYPLGGNQPGGTYPTGEITWIVDFRTYEGVKALGPFPFFSAAPVISGNPVVDQTLTVEATNAENYSILTYQWYKGNLSDFANGFIGGQILDGETGSSYVVGSDDSNPYRACAVTITSDKGSTVRKLSNVLGPVTG